MGKAPISSRPEAYSCLVEETLFTCGLTRNQDGSGGATFEKHLIKSGHCTTCPCSLHHWRIVRNILAC